MRKESEEKMKKKILTMVLSGLLLLGLTGCVTEKNRERILTELQEYGAIQEDWKRIGYHALDASPIPDVYAYQYYFTDADNVIYEVEMRGSVGENEEHDLYYPVSLSDHMEAYEEEDLYRESGEEKLQTRMVTRYRETDASVCTNYRVYRHKAWFFTFWKVEEEE